MLTRVEILLLQGDATGAERVARRALAILEPGLPAGHFATATAECRLGVSLARQSRHGEAEPLLEGSLERLRAWESTPERYLRECAEGLAELYAATGREDRARDLRPPGH
jgi:non-specific serine/threonine protein kinase/serine/threonine-protein kinase